MTYKAQSLEDFCIAGSDYSGDAFFLDTNTILAYLDEDHSFHLSTIIHIIYLLKMKAKIYVSETVLSETIDVLARKSYVDEMFQHWKTSAEHVDWLIALGKNPTDEHYKIKKDEIRDTFIRNVVKNRANPSLLKYHNQKATEVLSGIVNSELFRLSNTTYGVIRSAMHLAKSIPLQSNDALIAAAALSKKAHILSFDSDLKQTPLTYQDGAKKKHLLILSAKTPNNYFRSKYRAHLHMNALAPDLWVAVQQAVGGVEKFEEKFGPRPKAVLLRHT